MPLFGRPNVEKLKARVDVKGLVKALARSRDKAVRQAAAQVLGEIGDARVVEPLAAALRDRDERVRCTAAMALGRTGDTRVVQPLVAALKDGSWEVRRAAAEALGAIGEPAVEACAAALRDRDHVVRLGAVAALGAIGAPAVEPLVAALRDEGSNVRVAAAGVLGEIGDARAVEPLAAALRDQDEWLRRATAQALGKIGAPAMEPLITALQDRDPAVRRVAAGVLQQADLPADPATQAWYAAVKQDWARAASLGQAAVEPLVAALRDEDKAVRRAAAEARQTIGLPADPTVEAWYAVAKQDWARAASLGQAAVEPLVAALGDAGELCWYAADTLAQIGDPGAVEPLIAVLMDGKRYSPARYRAAQALVTLYRQGRLDERSKQRILAMRETLNRSHVDRIPPSDCHEDYGVKVPL